MTNMPSLWLAAGPDPGHLLRHLTSNSRRWVIGNKSETSTGIAEASNLGTISTSMIDCDVRDQAVEVCLSISNCCANIFSMPTPPRPEV